MSIRTTLNSDADVHPLHKRCDFPLYAPTLLLILPTLLSSSDVQTSAAFSDEFARVESGFTHFRTLTHDYNTRLATISAVDEEVDAARQLVRSLLTHRNALAPISLLPPEILSRIFHLLALKEPPYSVNQNFGWIKTTHVCRYWRQVALGDSSLWARISGTLTNLNTTSISEMLARARNALLEIDINFVAKQDVFLMLPPHLSHTRTLRLHSVPRLLFESVREFFSRLGEAPALEHFELRLAAISPITFEDFGETMLFKGQAPKLRTFCISQVCIPWSFIPHGQLTQMKIIILAEMSTTDTSLGNARQFIDLLVNCPALEILVLEFCLPCDLSQSSRGETVHLPRLSHLGVAGSSSRVTNLLKILRLPSTTKLHLHCTSEYDPPHNDHHIFSVASAHFQTSVPVEFKSLQVSFTKGRMLNIVAATFLPPSILQSSHDIELGMDDEAEFVLSFSALFEFNHWKGIVERACKMLHISNLEFLSITTDTVDAINWAELFKGCTNVTTIQSIGRGTSGFIRALTPSNAKNERKKKKRDDSGTSAVPAPGPVIFPNLTSLLLRNLDFTEIKSGSGVLYDVLVNGLRQRNSTYGIPIKEIHVDHCVIPAMRADALRRLVTEFHWDGEDGMIFAFHEFGYSAHYVEWGNHADEW